MGILHKLAHLVLAAFASVSGGPGGPVATGSISAGMQAGPSCVTRTLLPGQSATVYYSVINPNHSGWEKLDMSADRNGSALASDGTPPRSWLKLPQPQWVGPGASARVPVTVTIPSTGVKRGRYGATMIVTAYAPQPAGSGTHVGFGAGAGAFLEFSVGPHVSPPPWAFCTGRRDTYWRTWPLLPVCKAAQSPLQGRQAVCRVLPLAPPVASAKACGMTQAAWDAYMRQLAITHSQRFAHCWPHGSSGPDGTGGLLNTAQVYRHPFRVGWFSAPHYRFPDVPARYR